MDDKQQNPKPLRTVANRTKDLLKTYLKNEDGKAMNIPEHQKTAAEEIDAKNSNEKIKKEDLTGVILSDDEVNEIYQRLEDLDKERTDLKEQLVRKAAEFENFRKRTILEKQDMVLYSNERLLFRMLELLDDMKAAVENGAKSTDYDVLFRGIEMIYQKATKIFEENGVKMMESAVGTPFNVDLHDALMVMPSELPEGNVVQEISPGYLIHDKVLRHSKVITSSGAPVETVNE